MLRCAAILMAELPVTPDEYLALRRLEVECSLDGWNDEMWIEGCKALLGDRITVPSRYEVKVIWPWRYQDQHKAGPTNSDTANALIEATQHSALCTVGHCVSWCGEADPTSGERSE